MPSTTMVPARPSRSALPHYLRRRGVSMERLCQFALIIGTSDTCGEDNPVAVIDDTDDSVQGCYPDQEAAQAAIDEANGNAAAQGDNFATVVPPPTTVQPPPVDLPEHAVVVVALEGENTADYRIVEPGALDWRELPLTITVNHDPDRIAGRIDAMGRVADPNALTVDNFAEQVGTAGNYVVAFVTFDLAGEEGQEAARQVSDKFLRGISMEVGDEQVEWECLEMSDDGWCEDELMHLVYGKIGAVTFTPFQALESAVVIDSGTSTTAPAATLEIAGVPSADEAIAASAARFPALVASAFPDVPPREWFEDPHLTEATPLTITDEGHIFGHVAGDGTCHVGYPGQCMTVPRGGTYQWFHLGSVQTTEGLLQGTGVLTMDARHCDLRDGQRIIGMSEAIAHYDHTGTGVADIVCGEDAHGVWFSGAVRSTVTDAQLRVLRAAKVSGDWRPVRGTQELAAAHLVNTPGFPIPRPRQLVKDGQTMGVVAAGIVRKPGCVKPRAELADRVDRLESIVAAAGLEDAAVAGLAASIGVGA